MSANIFTEILLPLALALIMFGMGLSLSKQDFTRLWQTPKPIIIGLIGQIILLPLLAVSIALLFNLSAPLAIGLLILAACPGGTMSNVISQLAKANLALSVSLTAISTLVCVVTTPMIIQYAVTHFAGAQAPSFSLTETAIGLFVITLVPVQLGILVKHYCPNWAMNIEVYFRRFSLVFMIAMIVLLMVQERELLLSSFEQVFFASLALNVVSLLMGLALAKLGSLAFREAITLAIEVGIQNATLAILIAVSFLKSPEYAVSAGVYGVAMYIGPLILVLWAKKYRPSQGNVQANKQKSRKAKAQKRQIKTSA
ncbi:bile acid:sodium symporter family protein [Thalassotalea sp. PLHSN55]|uniref:bile acid:sodium symporter family protein n=1 Tax=Thalassotalea sp. PLHSN55 TaxID=3435888 RepID=UPI003F82816D